MKTSSFNRYVFGVSLAFLFLPLPIHAEIFKWVDAKGQTHYSERKEDAGKVKPEEVKVRPLPTSARAPNSSTPDWKEQEHRLKERQAQRLRESTADVPVARVKSLSGGRSDDTASSKCNLARDVLSGAVRHTNGAPTDKYDLEVAKNDVSAFCR
ncbi:DUF4124 domain-containing protein [Polaromonas sp. A23]|uniref:DUF4124 domain-containing protein n=1 Tax=Polaromonas sp. A23 TaxID=1944133 RepID=UPI0009841CF4|nr:DUF4124 domain-containing protein [Polaromonas sp. A23]OOG42866.1 hypothetical protein B0B52_09370 [Polaromonas sp. A23]